MTRLALRREPAPHPPEGEPIKKWWVCTRKLAYSKANAAREILIRNIQRPPNSREFTSYVCRYCGSYHIGHVNDEGHE